MKGIYIRTPIGIVAGFSGTHQCVQTTDHPAYVKYFKTRAGADRFITEYADIGYGLASETAKIVEESCDHCGWEGAESDLHCDRGGHNFVCPNCKKEI